MPIKTLSKYARPLAVIVLLAVTSVGAWKFATGDWTDVLDYWGQHIEIIPVLILFSLLDVTLESIAWMWSYTSLGIRAFDRKGGLVYLAGRAGLLMPAQLGRLIRPDAMVRLDRAPMLECLKAETVMFVLDGVSVLALLAGLIIFKVYPLLAIPAATLVILVLVYSGNKIADLFAHTHFNFRKNFWWSWSAMGIIAVQMAGWVMHGLALYVVVAGLPGAMNLWDALFFGPGSAVLGTGTGLPGGIGATEGLLGASMRFREVPAEHLAVAVAAFRLITFWAWIPIGWFALVALRGRKAAVAKLKEH